VQHNYQLDAERSVRLRERFRGMLERHIPGLRISGNRATGLCPFHDDHHPSFSADLERCYWRCFACDRRGGVRDFALLVGEAWDPLTSFPSFTSRPEACHQRADRAALATARAAYEAWCREKLHALADKYQDLCAEREVCEIALHQTQRCPESYTPPERSFWEQRLACIYDTLPPLENDLDILTYRQHEDARLAWWLEETKHGQDNL